jgi:ADP-ribose pyrophosphatase YjhB (NUDIX family)
MVMNIERPKVGLGVIVENDEGLVLVGKRIGSHAPYWSIPGGNLDLGETFEAGAIREVKEESGLDIIDPEVIGVTNNLRTFREEGIHYISVILLAKRFFGKPRIMEPDKCAEYRWVKPEQPPMPHFDASELGLRCHLEHKFYVGLRE